MKNCIHSKLINEILAHLFIKSIKLASETLPCQQIARKTASTAKQKSQYYIIFKEQRRLYINKILKNIHYNKQGFRDYFYISFLFFSKLYEYFLTYTNDFPNRLDEFS